MKKLSRIPKMVIWLAFSVVTGFGYAFSFFIYAQKHVKLSFFHTVIPMLIWILAAVLGLVFMKKVYDKNGFWRFSNKERIFLEGSVLALLFCAGYVFRFTAPFSDIWQKNLSEYFFEYAQVVQDRTWYLSPHFISRIYVRFLHIVCLLFGNIYEIGTTVQFCLLILGVFIWYIAIRKLFGLAAALFFAAGAMLLSDSILSSLQCDPSMLLFCIYGCTALFMICYAKKKRLQMSVCAWIEILLGILTACCIACDISGVLFLFAFGATLTYVRKRQQKACYSYPYFAILGLIIGAGIFLTLPMHMYDISLKEALRLQSYYGLSCSFAGADFVHAYLMELGKHKIFIFSIIVIMAYWFVRHKRAITYMMGAILFLFGLSFLGLDIYMKHDFLIYMSLLVLTGVTCSQCFQTYEKKEPNVTVINFDQQQAVEVPELSE